MSENRSGDKENGKPISLAETGQNQPRRSKRKVPETPDTQADISPRGPSSPPSSPEPKGRRRGRRDSHSPRRSRRRSRSPTRSKSPPQDTRDGPTPAKRSSRRLKRGLVALGGVLAAGLPIAGELYLKHLAHEHEREKDERKEVRHEQAMEEKERRMMDLELQATEEQTGWMTRKHGIDIKRREVELQIRELERDGLVAERRPRGGMEVVLGGAERGPAPRRIRTATRELQRLPYQSLDETAVLPRNPRSSQEDRAMVEYQPQPQQQQPRRRQPRSPRPPTDLPPPSLSVPRPRRKRTPSPPPASRHPHAIPTTTALLAGSLTAYRVRGDEGPWRKKALRVAASAGTAALASLSFEGAREDGRVAEGAWGVAVPVMAGIGAERILWGERRG